MIKRNNTKQTITATIEVFSTAMLAARVIAKTFLKLGVLLAVVVFSWGAGTALAVPLTNTPVTEGNIDPLIPNPPTPAVPAEKVLAVGIADDLVDNDCVGTVHSAAFDLGGGHFLYAYQLENHCSPNWNVGYAVAGGGLKVPLNGNVPVAMDFDGDTVATDTSFHTTETASTPFVGDLSAMNAGNIFPIIPSDFTTSATTNAHVELFNADGIIFTGDVAGFVACAAPTTQAGAHLGGTSATFDLVVPGTACVVDTDGDGVPDSEDNCPVNANADQTDNDGDGAGDVCDTTPLGACTGATRMGTPGNDVLNGTNGADIIAGLGGNDTITGGNGEDILCGGEGNDTLSGDNAIDQLFGNPGDDTLNGNRGNDALSGGDDTDSCNGGQGSDTAVSCESTSSVP